MFTQFRISFVIGIFYAALCLFNLAWGYCEAFNIFEQIGTYHSHMGPRDQNYGTCYAEASSYAYNLVEKSCEDRIHPLYFVYFNGSRNNIISVDSGYTNNSEIPFIQEPICSYEGVENIIHDYLVLIQSLFSINISMAEAERDLIAALQAYMILLNVKSNLPLIAKYQLLKLNGLFKSEETYLQNNLTINSKILYTIKSTSNLLADILQLLYGKSLNLEKLKNANLKQWDFDFKNNSLRYKSEKYDFKKLIYSFFNDRCSSQNTMNAFSLYHNNKQAIEINSKNRQTTLANIITYLKHGNPVTLSLNGKVLDPATDGMHGVVIVGSRFTRARTCEILIRNSWGEKYPGVSDCYCYDHSQSKFKGCYNGENKKKSLEVLGCWYNWEKIAPVATIYRPVTI